MRTYWAGYLLCGYLAPTMSSGSMWKQQLEVCWINGRGKPTWSGPPAFGAGLKALGVSLWTHYIVRRDYIHEKKCFGLAGRLLAFQEGFCCMQQLMRRCNPWICPSVCLISKRFEYIYTSSWNMRKSCPSPTVDGEVIGRRRSDTASNLHEPLIATSQMFQKLPILSRIDLI